MDSFDERISIAENLRKNFCFPRAQAEVGPFHFAVSYPVINLFSLISIRKDSRSARRILRGAEKKSQISRNRVTDKRTSPAARIRRIIRKCCERKSLPVGLLLFSVEFAIRLLQLIGEQFQVARQFVIRFKLLRHQDQISSGVVQRDVTQIQTPPGAERITWGDIAMAETFVTRGSEKSPLVVSSSTSHIKLLVMSTRNFNQLR